MLERGAAFVLFSAIKNHPGSRIYRCFSCFSPLVFFNHQCQRDYFRVVLKWASEMLLVAIKLLLLFF